MACGIRWSEERVSLSAFRSFFSVESGWQAAEIFQCGEFAAFTCSFQQWWRQSSSCQTLILLHSHLSHQHFCVISAEKKVNFSVTFCFTWLNLTYCIPPKLMYPPPLHRPRWVTQACCVSRRVETHGWLLITLQTYLWSQYGAYFMSSILHWVTVQG